MKHFDSQQTHTLLEKDLTSTFQIIIIINTELSFLVPRLLSQQKNKQNKQTCAAQTMATMTTETPADINAHDSDGNTKLCLAAEAGNAAEVERLLELKADFELPKTDYRKYLSAVAF